LKGEHLVLMDEVTLAILQARRQNDSQAQGMNDKRQVFIG
jgi:hypothetical protein